MSLNDWKRNGWLRQHAPDKVEIQQLLAVVERDLRVGNDANMDPDWRFVAAYNAALQCAAVALHASGFAEPKGGGAHQRTIDTLKFTIGDDGQAIDELQAFRSKRGGTIYEKIGIASPTEITEICILAASLRDRVLAWLRQTHPQLLKRPVRGRNG